MVATEVAVEAVLMVLCICIYIYTISNTYIRIYISYTCVYRYGIVGGGGERAENGKNKMKYSPEPKKK